MSSIWTNPSVQRSLVQRNIVKTELLDYAKFTISSGTDTSDDVSYVSVFPGLEYTVTFYDTTTGALRTVTGLVMNVWEDQIKIMGKPESTSTAIACDFCANKDICLRYKECIASNTTPTPSSTCVHDSVPDTYAYVEPEIIFISIANIMSIKYTNDSSNVDNIEEPIKLKGTRVMILGISATTVKAIIVRLEFFDDCLEDAIKKVDLEVGGVYNIAYESRDADGTIYETMAKIIGIEEIPVESLSSQPNCGCGFVREGVGFDDSVYIYHECCSKDQFMQAGPAKKVKLIVDTSETFEGRYESIMLDAIRDVELISAPNDSTVPDHPNYTYCKNCTHKTMDCDPGTCRFCNPGNMTYHPIGRTYKLPGGNMVSIDSDDKVTIRDKSGAKTECTMKDILSFYLGVE